MSGSGGGGTGARTPQSSGLQSDQSLPELGTGASPDESTDPCDIIENTTLNSPDKTVLAMLRAGDALNIELREQPRRLLATRGDHVAGSITSANHAHIVQCIRSGRAYTAIVRSIRGGLCHVRIQPT